MCVRVCARVSLACVCGWMCVCVDVRATNVTVAHLQHNLSSEQIYQRSSQTR